MQVNMNDQNKSPKSHPHGIESRSNIAQLFSLFVKVSEYAIEMVDVEMLGDRHFSAK